MGNAVVPYGSLSFVSKSRQYPYSVGKSDAVSAVLDAAGSVLYNIVGSIGWSEL
jgi:hypothetical protein